MLKRILNYLASRSSSYKKVQTENEELRLQKSQMEQILESEKTSRNQEKQISQGQMQAYEQQILKTQKEKKEILERAMQNIQEANELASRRVMAALVASKQSTRLFDLEEFSKFNEFEAAKNIIKECRSLKEEKKFHAANLEEMQQDISRLEAKVLELQANAFADVITLYSQTSRKTKKAPVAIYSAQGESVYQSRTFELLLKKYAPNEKFAIDNALISPEFREQLYQQEEIIEKCGKLTARFRSYSHDDKQTAISVSLSLAAQEEGRTYKVIGKAEEQALKIMGKIWKGCKNSFRPA